jgi:hypothetical protein
LLLIFVRHEKACLQRCNVENWSKNFIAFAEIIGYSFVIDIKTHEVGLTEFHF